MKTELEWVSVDKELPKDGFNVIGIINLKKESPLLGSHVSLFRFEGKWKTFDSRLCFEGNKLIRVTFKYFENREITHWAYVNLPEEEEKKYCYKCGTNENVYSNTLLSNPPRYFCKGCNGEEKYSRLCYRCDGSEMIFPSEENLPPKVFICSKCKEKEKEKEGFKCYKCGNKNVTHKLTLEGIEFPLCQKCWEEPFNRNVKFSAEGVKDIEEEIDRDHCYKREKDINEMGNQEEKNVKRMTGEERNKLLSEQRNYVQMMRNKMVEDEWIWPLKQLPEEGKKVELISLGCNVSHMGFYQDKRFIDDEGGETCLHVIAWRPLIEKIQPFNCPICPNCKKNFSRSPIGEMGFMSKSMYCDECTESFQNHKPKERNPEDKVEKKCDEWMHVNKALPGIGSNVEISWLDGKKRLARFTVSDVGKQDLCFYDLEGSLYLNIPDYWRPLRDGAHNAACGSCKKHPCECSKKEDRKPDFSKLKEGDLIIADYEGNETVGFYRPFNDKNILMGFFRCGGGGMMEKEKIKKVIRINIGEKNKFSGLTFDEDKNGKLIQKRMDAYPFEEI